MAYNLTEQESQVLTSLASGYTDRETYQRLGVSRAVFDKIWTRITEEFESNDAETWEETDLRHAYHRVERRRLEAELWASEARLAALMDTAPEAIFLINGRTGIIERVNNQVLLLFGYSQRELIGRPVEMLLEEDIRELHIAYRQGFLSSTRKREMGYHPAIHGIAKDGRLIPMDIALTATSATDDVMAVCKPTEVPSTEPCTSFP